MIQPSGQLIPMKDKGQRVPLVVNAMVEELITAGFSPFADAWDFCCRAVFTRDEARGEVRPFPRYNYLAKLLDARAGHLLFAVEKSRRMYVSWFFVCIYLYDTLTQPNHANYIASRKLETSCELLGRMYQVYESIPTAIWAKKPSFICHAGPTGQGFRRLDCPAVGSHCEAVAEGKDQLRQYTASNILLDEFAFWEKAEESWSALRPTVEGGGHIDIVSTPELGSFMYELLYEGGVNAGV
jgi:hypothetical protein